MVTLHLVTAVPDVINQFLDFLYGDNEGYAYSPTRDPNKEVGQDNYWNQHFFNWPVEREQLLTHITSNSSNFDVYISPALFNSPSSKKEDFKLSRTIWAEFDGSLPTAAVLEAKGVIEPNLRIQSSRKNYEHWYWLNDSTDRSYIELTNRRIAYYLGADSSGWDINQVLRIPSTLNHKQNINSYVTMVSDINTNKFDNSKLSVLPEQKPLDLDLSSIPDVTQVVLKYAWPKYAGQHYLTPKFDNGTRSDALMKLGYYCIEMGMTDAEAYSILYNADSRWQKFNTRTDRLKRLSEIISRARIKFPTKSNETSRLHPIGAISLVKSERRIEWLIPGLLESMGSMLLTGPSGVGKSQFTLNSCVSLALGVSFLNFKISKPIKLLFASLEMGWPQIQWMMEKIATGMSAEQLQQLETNLHILPLGEPLHLNQSVAQKEFETLLQEGSYDGFIIDSLGSAISGDLGNHKDVQPYIDWNDKTRNKYQCFSWAIHHHRKGNGDNRKPNKLDDVYGDQYITARATSVYCLWPGSNKTASDRDLIEVIPLKKRLDRLESPWMIERDENLHYSKPLVVTPSFTKITKAPEPTKTLGM